MSEPTDADDGLHSQLMNCSHCGALLYRVDHSPFYDVDFFYCDRCPNHVEVSFYDPKRTNLSERFPAGDEGTTRQARILAGLRKIESALRPCNCGGRYRFDTARRCYECSGEVIVGEPYVDLWPGFFGLVGERDTTAEEDVKIADFEARYVRREDLWT